MLRGAKTLNQKRSVKDCFSALCYVALAFTLEIHSKEERLVVRLDLDIPPQEKEYLKKRKVVVAQALQKMLGLGSPPETKKVKCNYLHCYFCTFALAHSSIPLPNINLQNILLINTKYI